MTDAERSHSLFEELLLAIQGGEEQEVRQILAAVPIPSRATFVNSSYPEGAGTALHACISAEQNGILEELLVCGANPDSLTATLDSPLHLACARENKEAIQLLLRFGANVHMENNNYQKCFQLASAKNQLDIWTHVQACLAENEPAHQPEGS
mmetsp:Transcript_28627/g.56251  ORF Transcript_28627/g.56251 Transcript_28627/m.56251 type:complete len:152 (-) Transcript_28627:4-459(-)